MPKPIYNFDPNLIPELWNRVLNALGFVIRSKKDCEILSKRMNDMGLGYISESTLYRFFINYNNKHSFYKHTLDALAAFCGEKDLHHFEIWFLKKKDIDVSFGLIDHAEKPIKSLVHFCLDGNSLKPLYNFVEQIEEVDFPHYYNLGIEFYKALHSNTRSNLTFFKNFSQLPFVRQYFFEHSVDIDFTIKDYELGLSYYLNNISPENSTKELNDFIFGRCILFRHHVKNDQVEKIKWVGNQLYKKYSLTDKQIEKLHIYPRLRYLSYKLFFLKFQDDAIKFQFHAQYLINYCTLNIDKWDNLEQRIAFSCIAETFIIVNIPNSYVNSLKTVFWKLIQVYTLNKSNASLKELFKYTQVSNLKFIQYY
jgi:hypothetical protein